MLCLLTRNPGKDLVTLNCWSFRHVKFAVRGSTDAMYGILVATTCDRHGALTHALKSVTWRDGGRITVANDQISTPTPFAPDPHVPRTVASTEGIHLPACSHCRNKASYATIGYMAGQWTIAAIHAVVSQT
jgi:hypothetical protein